MRMILAAAFLASFLSPLQSAYSEIREIREISEIMSEAKGHGTWIVFDIDNTILEPAQTLGSDQWFYYMLGKLGSLDETISLYKKILNVTTVRPVENYTPELIQELQGRGLYVFAVTARSSFLESITLRQLKSLSISLDQVIYLNPKLTKGQVIVNEIQSKGSPTKVIFVDDNKKHVENVDTALSAYSFPHIEFRYSYADEKVARFNPHVADNQLVHFKTTGRLISD